MLQNVTQADYTDNVTECDAGHLYIYDTDFLLL